MPISKQTFKLIVLFIVAFGFFGLTAMLIFFVPPEENSSILKVLIGAMVTVFVTVIGGARE